MNKNKIIGTKRAGHPIFEVAEGQYYSVDCCYPDLDWFDSYTAKIPKDEYPHIELVLRYGGGHRAETSWYLECSYIRDGKKDETHQYPITHIVPALKAFHEMPIKCVRTYDNHNGLKIFMKKYAEYADKLIQKQPQHNQ